MPGIAATTTDDASPSTRAAALSRRRLRWFVSYGLVGGLLGGGIALTVAPLLPTTYTAESRLLVSSPGDRAVFAGAGSANVPTDPTSVAQVMRSADVAGEASTQLDGRLSAEEVSQQVRITTDNSQVVIINATAATPALARDLADAVPQAYLTVEAAGYQSRSDQTDQVLGELLTNQQARLNEVQAQLATKTADAFAKAPVFANEADRVTYVRATLETDVDYQRLQNDAASLASTINSTMDAMDRSNVNYLIAQLGADRVVGAQSLDGASNSVSRRNILLGAFLGLLAGTALAWWLTERRRVVDTGAAAAALGAPHLGTFGPERELRRFPRLADLAAERAVGNELQVVASSLLLSARRQKLGAIVVTSAKAREGKTVLATNLAAAAEYTGESVALVDAGNGGASLTKALTLSEAPGLAEILDGGPVSDAIHRFSYDDDRTLSVVPVGYGGWRKEPGRRLNEARRAAWTETLSAGSQVTAIVDTPAVNAHALPLQLAQHGGLLVVVSPRTTLGDLDVIRTRAEIADVPVLGFVINEFLAPSRPPRTWPPRRGGERGRLHHMQSDRTADPIPVPMSHSAVLPESRRVEKDPATPTAPTG